MGGTVETLAKKLGMKPAGLSSKERHHRSARGAHYAGCIVGVTIGCLLGIVSFLSYSTAANAYVPPTGMFPLLFLDDEEELLKKKQELKQKGQAGGDADPRSRVTE